MLAKNSTNIIKSWLLTSKIRKFPSNEINRYYCGIWFQRIQSTQFLEHKSYQCLQEYVYIWNSHKLPHNSSKWSLKFTRLFLSAYQLWAWIQSSTYRTTQKDWHLHLSGWCMSSAWVLFRIRSGTQSISTHLARLVFAMTSRQTVSLVPSKILLIKCSSENI